MHFYSASYFTRAVNFADTQHVSQWEDWLRTKPVLMKRCGLSSININHWSQHLPPSLHYNCDEQRVVHRYIIIKAQNKRCTVNVCTESFDFVTIHCRWHITFRLLAEMFKGEGYVLDLRLSWEGWNASYLLCLTKIIFHMFIPRNIRIAT